jgi:hypothetical protein
MALMLTGITGTAVVTQAQAIPTPIAKRSTADSTMRSDSDHAEIINAVNGIALFADLRDWQRCRQSFTNTVEFDYTSLVGGEPTVIAANQQMQQWATFFDGTFKTTQHILGSHVVTVNGNQATCLSNFQAHHTYLDPTKGSWVLSGFYQHDLVRESDRWKVSKMKMTWTWEDGTRPF